MKYVLFLWLIVLFTLNANSQTSLERTDSVRIDQANIWGVLANSSDDDKMALTVSRGNIIYFQYINENLERVTDQVAVYGDEDDLPQIVDHKTVFWKDHYYITFSSAGDRQLYLVKLDQQGTRVGDIIKIYDQDDRPANEPGKPTNDMIMVATDDVLYVGHFIPANQHYIHAFDADLNRVEDPFATDGILAHNNVGGALFANEKIHLFTGTMFGADSDLILTRWDNNFGPFDEEVKTLIDSEAGHANWFATGVAFDAETEYWYVGFQHLYPGEVLDEEHVDLAVFDKCFNLIDRIEVSSKRHYRPHLLIKNGVLYMAYDKGGQGVFIHKYDLLEGGLGASECEDDNGEGEGGNGEGDFLLDQTTIEENLPADSKVGEFGIEGMDASKIVFELVSGEGSDNNSSFLITDNVLLSAEVFDFEEVNLLKIRVRASQGDRSGEKMFEIEVLNVVEHELLITGELNFGTVPVGDSKELELQFLNNGQDDGLEITNITVPEGFSVNTNSFTLKAAEFETVKVTFEPTSQGTYNGLLEITSSLGEQEVAIEAVAEVVSNSEFKELQAMVTVYPNPAQNFIDVRILNSSLAINHYQIIDLQGRQQKKYDLLFTNSHRINTADLGQGKYFLILRTTEGNFIAKKVMVK